MDNKLTELEYIFNKLQAVPKRQKRESFTATKLDEQPVSFIVPDNDLINTNIQYIDTIQQLKENASKMELMLKEYECQVSTLNAMNHALKLNETELKNAVLKAKGAIRVLCRIKPAHSIQNVLHDDISITIDSRRFILNHIFEQRSTQEDVFAEIKPEIQSIADGYNVCIFAYGQTGSGKTHTMEGPLNDRGLAFRALSEIGRLADSLGRDGFSISYSVKYLEVYNEQIRDLVKNENVVIVHDQASIRLKNCTEIATSNIKEIEELVEDASTRRKTAETKCNSSSSRSHLVFVLKILIEKDNEKREGSLCLIDLAGSERLNESKAEDLRLKETQHINKSLSALGDVMAALKRKDRHIPFRNSKLTHLMQEYLTNNSRTSMIVNINLESINETICSLRFATKVSECMLGIANRNVSKII